MTEMHQKVEQSPLPVKIGWKNKLSGFTDFFKKNPNWLKKKLAMWVALNI